ncbi:MAG: hypothetical protein RL701_375 [Pseudomonadota bacterium]
MRERRSTVSTPLALVTACTLFAGCPNLSADLGGDDSADSSASTSASAGSGGGACALLDGLYEVSYRRVAGNCGPLETELLEFRQGRAIPPGTQNCRTGAESMRSACDFVFDRTCSVSDPFTGVLIGAVRITGTLSEVDGNQRAEGDLEVEVAPTSGASCKSTFHVTALRS